MESWMWAWNGSIHSLTSNWRELITVVETLIREEVGFNKLRCRMVFYFTDNEVTYNIYKKGYSKNLSLHLIVQQLKALELALGCRLEVIHVPGTTMITQGMNGLSRGIWANGFNTDFMSFVVEVFLPALPSLSLTKWDIIHIGIQAEHAAWWNIETDTSSRATQNFMHSHTFWILSPGVARQGLTLASMACVESPWESSHLFLVPMIQHRSFGHVNKHVDLIRKFIGEGHTHLLSLLFCITSRLLKVPSKLTETMEWTHLTRYEHHRGLGTKLIMCVSCEGYIPPGNVSHFVSLEVLGMS
jgi:hypothetical protein